MNKEDFINGTDLVFIDISSEEIRRYVFQKNDLMIEFPLYLHVSESGGHRIIDACGQSYYIKPTWDFIVWKVKEGMPHFVK